VSQTDLGIPYGISHLHSPSHLATSTLSLSMVKPKRVLLLVLFLATSLGVLCEPTLHQAPGRHRIVVSALSRLTLLWPILSPETKTRAHLLYGVAPSPLLVPFLLVALTTLYGQTANATSGRARPRLL
jgi:hypothetical protein